MREASETGNHPWLGSLVVAVSATAYSTAGFFTRLIDLDIWTVLFWRGLFAGLSSQVTSVNVSLGLTQQQYDICSDSAL
jgi:hypothetical protein